MATKKRKFRKSPKPLVEVPGAPIRHLAECSPHRTTGGRFVEGITQFDAEYESHIESGVLNHLLLCHDVRAITSQASEEPYSLEGKIRHHIPDFTVDAFVDGLRLEVKSLTFLVREDSLDKYVAIARAYRERQIPFAFLVDAQLAEEPRSSSVKLLSRYVTSRVPANNVARITETLTAGPLSILDLMTRASVELVDVWSMIATRKICFDWSIPLHPRTTVVSLPAQPFGGLALESIIGSGRYSGLLAEMAMGRRPANKPLLADAATWRRSRQPVSPRGFFGGAVLGAPLRSLTEEERLFRNAYHRGGFSLGQVAGSIDAGK
ncbi:hypothetical protein [Propionivibrio dicarboxylicus]|uniref:TnsA endonuclease N terminal n=1 Tax=Propionivibrio dicarboxylicus TaxID=83767 RepID=A0A1G7V9A9_9RHOO|nr:hypothetical protein [Propionivibrio dicarboxylicus]SDG56307.1 hypothetical protein SAMN05660652_00132 [Propionivibrio dicarboxylicus]